MLSVWLWLDKLSLSLATGGTDDDKEEGDAAPVNGDSSDAVGDSGPLINEAVGE
jgi:hypothetical protein